jgi:hypothetical protein
MKRMTLAAAGVLVLAAVLLLSFRRAPASTGVAGKGASAGGFWNRARAVFASGKPAQPAATGRAVVSGGWGGEPGQFGRRRDAEANPEGPMALAAAGGEVAVVDQINRRVQRFKDGKLTGTIPIGGDTVQDMALAPGGRTVLLDRLVDGTVQIYGPDGKLENQLAIAGKGIDEGGDVTGVFADDGGIYVERQHGSVIQLADARGATNGDRPELLGRPSRDGRFVLQVEIADPTGAMLVRATTRSTGELAWVQTVKTDAPILHVVMLDSDRAGNVYVAAEVGRESAEPPYELADVHLVALRLGNGGALTGQLRLPALGAADETFRPLTVDDDGVLYLMLAQENGLQVLRFTF